jgi:hypothetical protein
VKFLLLLWFNFSYSFFFFFQELEQEGNEDYKMWVGNENIFTKEGLIYFFCFFCEKEQTIEATQETSSNQNTQEPLEEVDSNQLTSSQNTTFGSQIIPDSKEEENKEDQ